MPANGPPVIPSLRLDQRRQCLEAVEASRQLRAKLRAKRGGALVPDSWELVNEARDERTTHLEEGNRGSGGMGDEATIATHDGRDEARDRRSRERQR